MGIVHLSPEELSALLDRELSPQVELRARQHLALCESCSAEYALSIRLDAELRQPPVLACDEVQTLLSASLDRETSGVLVFAKNFHARERLKEQFAAHVVDRIYVAIIEGEIQPPSGTIRSYLLEGRDLRMRSVDAHPDAKFAVTHYRTVTVSPPYSMLEVTLETGRKNQIRAHLSEAGHAVVGDHLYGAVTNPLGRLGLHAKLLGFAHPTTGKKMSFTAPIPKSFRTLFGAAVSRKE